MRALIKVSLFAFLSSATYRQAQGQAPEFEVASIKPHPPAVDVPLLKNPDVNPIRISGNRVELQMIGLKGLVMAAYNVKEYQVSGGPGWATGLEMYDIAAKTEGDAVPSMGPGPDSCCGLCLRSVFIVKLRRESKQLPAYDLVVAKGRPKVKRVADDAAPTPGMRRGSMEQLAALLSLMVDRPVIDKTGLAGIYEYSNGLTLLNIDARSAPGQFGGRVLQGGVKGDFRLTARA